MTDAANPLLKDWDTPFGLPPFAWIDDAHFAPAARRRAGRGGASIFAAIADNPETADLRQHDRGAGAGRRHARPGGGRVLQPRRVGFEPGARGAAAGLRAQVLGLFLGDHQQRQALRPDRRSVGAPGASRAQRRTDARGSTSPIAASCVSGAALGDAARDRLTEVKGASGRPRHTVLRRTCWPMNANGSWNWPRRISKVCRISSCPPPAPPGEEKGAGGPVVTLFAGR